MPKLPSLSELESQALGKGSPSEALGSLRELLKGDPRGGAAKLLAKFEKKIAAGEKEKGRQESLWVHEKEALARGFKHIAGVDEAGRGPLAGPVVAGAVILAPDRPVAGVNDSKKLTGSRREELFPLIQERAVAFGVGQASAQEIDELNIYRATQLAMERALDALEVKADFLLTDAMPLPKLSKIPQKPLIHGDSLSASIAAASILAKVTRDHLMRDLHEKYPDYGFLGHKGYGTEVHLAALREKGACPEHRRSFAPVMEVLATAQAGGPFSFWKEKLLKAKDLRDLQQAGREIKRAALSQLSGTEIESLRDLFREKRSQWERKS